MKLTAKQRKEGIDAIIESDMECCYKPRDIYMQYYEGILPYKNMKDAEIIEWYEERETPLPTK